VEDSVAVVTAEIGRDWRIPECVIYASRNRGDIVLTFGLEVERGRGIEGEGFLLFGGEGEEEGEGEGEGQRGHMCHAPWTC